MTLITTAHLESPDDFYEALLLAHKDLSAADSQAFNARLILVLANHIGRLDVLKEALAAAALGAKSPTAAASPGDAATPHRCT